jgi:23S rRNA pseudouridine1911/1915/1917 synthase
MAPLNSGYEFREKIGSKAAGMKILDYLAGCYARVSREEWLDRMESGRVLLNGIPAEPEMILSAGAILSWLRPPWEEPDVPLSYAILYRDEHFLGVAKPSGLPTLPGGGQFMDNTLLTLVRRRFPEANPLHRLGRGTSGVLLFARTQEAFGKISQAWRNLKVVKVYRALAKGSPPKDAFDIDVPIGVVPHPVLKAIHAASMNGKPAHSSVRVLERREDSFLLEAQIATGRPHQIRIHLAAAGYPLVGDPLYGIGGVPKENGRALPGDLGYHLHSERLGFAHPFTHTWTEIICFPPPCLRLGTDGANL